MDVAGTCVKLGFHYAIDLSSTLSCAWNFKLYPCFESLTMTLQVLKTAGFSPNALKQGLLLKFWCSDPVIFLEFYIFLRHFDFLFILLYFIFGHFWIFFCAFFLEFLFFLPKFYRFDFSRNFFLRHYYHT